jgi:hypothetical protein
LFSNFWKHFESNLKYRELHILGFFKYNSFMHIFLGEINDAHDAQINS